MVKKYCKIIGGYGLIILGFIGLFLPFLQGILFLVLGCMVLSSESPTFRKLMAGLKAKYPELHTILHIRKNTKLDPDDSEEEAPLKPNTV